MQNIGLFSGSLSKGFLIGGESTGANLAAVCTHRALSDQFFAQTKLTGVFLSIPIVADARVVDDKLVFQQSSGIR